jgi:hypothetical protein
MVNINSVEGIESLIEKRNRPLKGQIRELQAELIKLKQALTAPVNTEEKELPEFLMKDSEGKIITCFIGGADVTEHWNNYLSKTKTT